MVHVELTTPERKLFAEDADSVTLPAAEGEVTILPGHAPMLASLRAGLAVLRKGAREDWFAVAGGFVEVKDGKVLVLADSADRAEELDLAKVEEARARAAEVLASRRAGDDVAEAAAMAALERELARIHVARRHKSRGMGVG
jgi:F-type H+-transporting ATPase subunit epsilon